MDLRIAATAALLAASLSACAPRPGTQPAVEPIAPVASTEPVQAPPGAPGGLNGTYRGTSTAGTRANGRCPLPGPVTVSVRNNVVSRTWRGRAIQAPVQPDGTFSTQNGRVSMSGTVRDGRLDMTFGDDMCQFSYALTRG